MLDHIFKCQRERFKGFYFQTEYVPFQTEYITLHSFLHFVHLNWSNTLTRDKSSCQYCTVHNLVTSIYLFGKKGWFEYIHTWYSLSLGSLKINDHDITNIILSLMVNLIVTTILGIFIETFLFVGNYYCVFFRAFHPFHCCFLRPGILTFDKSTTQSFFFIRFCWL
jgi:hypothetical protein